MLQVEEALRQTTSHGLPRLVTKKPLYVRLTWLLLFLAFLGLFLKGFADFVVKLQSNQITNTLETNVVDFQYPDIYACFENAISTSFASSMTNDTANKINSQLVAAYDAFKTAYAARNKNASESDIRDNAKVYSFAYIQSIEYSLLVDALAHRLEQSVVTSDLNYVDSYGLPSNDPLQPTSFYHPVFLRCIRWLLNSSAMATVSKSGTASGLVATLLTDANYSDSAPLGPPILSKIFIGGTAIPVSDWSMSRLDYDDPDRRAGVRIFLCPPGEYPTPFVTSFSLGPGQYHTVDMTMTKQVYNPSSFKCVSNPPSVQFLNPYSHDPYNQSYSYSYCYYYEYHRLYQAATNLSGDASALPWPLRNGQFLFNLTGPYNFLQMGRASSTDLLPDNEQLSVVAELARNNCLAQAPCATLKYEVTISSTDWPSYSSVAPFVATTIAQALAGAKANNLTAPALEFLSNSSVTNAAAFINANMLKVNFRPRCLTCNRVTMSIDYGFANFISDVGGIMGIYLGMSLLSLCEILELIYDLAVAAIRKRRRVLDKKKLVSLTDFQPKQNGRSGIAESNGLYTIGRDSLVMSSDDQNTAAMCTAEIDEVFTIENESLNRTENDLSAKGTGENYPLRPAENGGFYAPKGEDGSSTTTTHL